MARPHYVTFASPKSKWTAFFICVPFGLFGFHYFYVGRIFRGLVALITMNFCAIGWFLDMAKILKGDFEDKYGAPLK